MKNLSYLLAITLALLLGVDSFSVLAQPAFGKADKIGDDWLFKLGDNPDNAKEQINDREWKSVTIPYDWSVKQPLSPSLASATGYLPGGIGWYRKKLSISKEDMGSKLFLYFEGVYNRSEVFVNGKSVGKRPNGYISFMYDVTPYLKFGEENMIAVRVDHSHSADSRWYTGSGIYRDVWLVKANPSHFSLWGVYAYPEVKKSGSSLNVDINFTTDTTGDFFLETTLLDAKGQQVALSKKEVKVSHSGEQSLQLQLKVKQPILWSLANPVLYTLRNRLLSGGNTVDESVTTTGFRDFKFDPNKGMSINGDWIKVKGVCLHHDAGVLGAAFYEEVWRRRLEELKKLGCNAVRTSHNPQSEKFYKLCDEIGLLVLNEAFDEWEYPKRKWLEGWNVGTPGFEGSYDIFKEWGEQDMADMVKRDRNHISIFAWSIGNEVDYPNDPYSHPVLEGSREGGFTQAIYGGYKKDAPNATELGAIAKRLVATIKRFDKSRPVTAGLAGVVMSNATEYPDALDIAGYNYTESRYIQDHKQYPKRVIYGSENRHDYAAWRSVRDNSHIFGQFLWTGIDYLGESGRWPSRGFYSGLLDFAGFEKPRGAFRKALWTTSPVSYLGTYPSPIKDKRQTNKDVWSELEANTNQRQAIQAPSMDAWSIWNYQEGESVRVVCYTNAAKTRLELNGKQVGEIKPFDDETGIVYWDIPFSSGKLEAVGMNTQGKEICRAEIQSSQRSFAITATLVESEIKSDGGVAQVLVQIVDSQSRPVILSDDEITCEINGPASLLGMENGNNTDMGSYTDNKQRVFHGKMIVYVRTSGKKGDKVQIQLFAPFLKSAEILLALN